MKTRLALTALGAVTTSAIAWQSFRLGAKIAIEDHDAIHEILHKD